MGKFGRILLYAVLVLLGLLIGAYTAWTGSAKIPSAQTGQRVIAGEWTADYSIGTSATDPKTRAMIARRGLLALPRSEAVYFTRTTDSDGQALSEGCAYEMTGSTQMGALWWSVTLYDQNDFLPRDAGNYSITGDQFEGGETFSATINKNGDLSTRNSGAFDLTLRLYKPDDWVISDPARLNLPNVKKLSCAEGL